MLMTMKQLQLVSINLYAPNTQLLTTYLPQHSGTHGLTRNSWEAEEDGGAWVTRNLCKECSYLAQSSPMMAVMITMMIGLFIPPLMMDTRIRMVGLEAETGHRRLGDIWIYDAKLINLYLAAVKLIRD